MALYALSYDEADALADYARVHGAAFMLLSDPASEVIERFGILNTLIDPDDHPWYGIPYPGVYVTDREGVVIAKFFESSLHFRPNADQLLRAALGNEVELPPVPRSRDEVIVDVRFDGEILPATVVRDLVVRFAVPDGQHLYGEPVPEGLVAASVEVDEALGLVVQPAILPPTTPHTLAGTGEVLSVYEGDVSIRVPIAQLSRSLTALDDGRFVQKVSGTVRWQACDDDACGLPQRERFELEIPAAGHDRPEHEFTRADGMDMHAHFTRMVERRGDRSVAQVLADMAGDG